MEDEPIKYHVRQFILGRDRFRDLRALDERILKDKYNHLDIMRAQDWCKVNPNIFYILDDSDKKIHGYMGVVPVSCGFVEVMLKERREIPKTLMKDYILSEERALRIAKKDGNCLYATMHICNPKSGKVDYHFGQLLFLYMEALYHKYRMRCIFGSTRTDAGKRLWEEAGCVKQYDMKKTDDGVNSLYYFDTKIAMQRPSAGLSVITSHIWGAQGYEVRSLLDLTDKEKAVLKLKVMHHTKREIAEILGIREYTVEGRLGAIDERAKEVGLNDRPSIDAYYLRHFFELI